MLAPAIAAFHDRLADLRLGMGQNPLPELIQAAALEPRNATRYVRLGQQAELAGEPGLAERSLLSAARHSRLFGPSYLLAQFYFRNRDETSFWRWSREALQRAYGDVLPLLDLCWRTRPDAQWLTLHVLPQRPDIRRQFLVCLTRHGELDAAGALAGTLVKGAGPEDQRTLVDYVDAALAAGETRSALDLWNALGRRGLHAYQPLEAPMLTNAFGHPPSGAGFDWRLTETPGVDATLGHGQLRLSFSGTQPEECKIMWQYAPVIRGERYRVAGHGLVDGLTWHVDGAGRRGDLARVSLVYRRPLGSPRFEGVVVLSDVRLERSP